jgi:hypothetical protein
MCIYLQHPALGSIREVRAKVAPVVSDEIDDLEFGFDLHTCMCGEGVMVVEGRRGDGSGGEKRRIAALGIKWD